MQCDDTDDKQSHRERAEARRRTGESDNDKDKNESADDLSDQVPAVVTNGWACGEHSELVCGIRFGIEVLLVGQPAAHRTEY